MKTKFLSEMHVMKSHFCILVTASLRRGREEVYEKIKSHSPNAEFKIREEKMDYDVIIE